MQLHSVPQILWDFRKILLIILGQNNLKQPGAMGCQKFFLKTANGKHLAAQRNLSGHGQIPAHGNLAQRTGNRRRNGDSSGWPIFRNCALRDMHMDIQIAVKIP